jgi:hypothetical protein
LGHFWCIDSPRANTNSQDSPQPILKEVTTFLLIVLFVLVHEDYTLMSFCLRTPKLQVPKFPKLGLPWLWRPITFYANFRLRCDFKQSYSPHREIFKDMQHATFTQVNQGDLQLLVIGSQIGRLTPDPSFGHNLCFKYRNGSCEPI